MESYIILFIYLCVLSLGFYIQTYAEVKHKPFLFLVSAFVILLGMLIWISNPYFDPNNTKPIIDWTALILYIFTVTYLRFRFKKWLMNKELTQTLPSKFQPIINECKNKTGLFENAIVVNKFNLSKYIANTDAYKISKTNIQTILKHSDYVYTHISQYSYGDIQDCMKLLQNLTDATTRMLHKFPLENNKNYIDENMQIYSNTTIKHVDYMNRLVAKTSKSNKQQEN